MQYNDLYNKSIKDKEVFWAGEAEKLTWVKKPSKILSQDAHGNDRWFADGRLNMSFLCLDAHVDNGYGTQTAIIYDSPATNTVEHISYKQLLDSVSHFAAGLRNLGVGKGSTVIIYMPMIPQAIIAMLACARIGAIHSVVFGGFAPHELALRIDDAKPKVIISASYGIEYDKKIYYRPLVEAALQEAHHKPMYQVYYNRENDLVASGNRDLDFNAMMKVGKVGPAEVISTHPLYILYTSGTTGAPKGVVRDTGGYATALRFTMEYFYDAKRGEVFFTASDIGWVVGHSYIVYAPLICGCTTILFEGKPVRCPDAGVFGRIIEQHKVDHLFTAPTAIRAIRKEDPDGRLMSKYNLGSLKQLFLAGERCDSSTWFWLTHLLNRPVIDHWWQTESGWPMLGIMAGLEPKDIKPGSSGKPVCGYDIQILDEDGNPSGIEHEGNVAIKLPLPPGCLTSLWNNEPRFRNSYFDKYPGYYLAGDSGYIDADGFFHIMGRIDDVINVSGHRLSTGEMEEIVASHPCVAECAVMGIADDLRGQRPAALVVIKDGMLVDEDKLEAELVQLIREKIGAVACFKSAAIVKRLPKTRSGKILRKTLCNIADGNPYAIPSTIDDPHILSEVKDKLAERKLGLAFQ